MQSLIQEAFLKWSFLEDLEFDLHKTRPLVVPVLPKFVFHRRSFEMVFSIEEDLTMCCSKKDPFIVYFHRKPLLFLELLSCTCVDRLAPQNK